LTFTYSTASHPFLFPHSAHHQPLHSFPTRRSSDLIGPTYTVKPFLQYYFDPSKYDPAQAVTIDTRQTYVPGNIFQGAICTINTRSEEHTSELQSRGHLVCRLLLEKKKNKENYHLSY